MPSTAGEVPRGLRRRMTRAKSTRAKPSSTVSSRKFPDRSLSSSLMSGGSIGGLVGGAGNVGGFALRGYALGGITTGPSIAGEAGPEAIVPLPNGRSIPVEWTGGPYNMPAQPSTPRPSTNVNVQVINNAGADVEVFGAKLFNSVFGRLNHKAGQHQARQGSDRTYCHLKPRCREGIALVDIALGKTGLEPLHPLCRCAVGKRVRHHTALALLLQAIIANGIGGVQGRFYIACFQPIVTFLRKVGPHPGQAVSLQYLTHQ